MNDYPNYAAGAARCGQWAMADQLLNLLGNRVKPRAFGGEEKLKEKRAKIAAGLAESKKK